MWKLILKLMILLIITMQLVRCTPPQAASSSKGGKSKLAPKKKIRVPLPTQLDLNSISLEDLVSMRPSEEKHTPSSKQYRHYFANHADVKKIDLHDNDIPQIVREIVDLSGDGKQLRPWKSRMAASIRNYLEDVPYLSEGKRKVLQDAIVGQRHKLSRQNIVKKHAEKVGHTQVKEQKRRAAEKFGVKNGGLRYGDKTQLHRMINPILDQPLSLHVGDERLDGYEAEKRAREMGHLYSGPNALSNELHKYLIKNNVPAQDIAIIDAIRARSVERASRYKRNMERLNGRTISLSQASTSASGDGTDRTET
jgi:hypothetical protein